MRLKRITYQQGYSDGYDIGYYRGYTLALEHILDDLEHRAIIVKEAMAEDKAVEYRGEDW